MSVPIMLAGIDDGYEDLTEGRLPFRLRMGVTGHRDLEDVEGVAEQIRGQLERIRDQFPANDETAVKFTLYSALAEGADRLMIRVAREVLGAAHGKPGVEFELRAVLPMRPEEYATDFETPESQADFAELLRVGHPEVLPAVGGREEAYELAGRHIVDKSDVLIAVWDGRESGRRGGTAEIVRYARLQQVPVLVAPASRTSTAGREPRIVAVDDTSGALEASIGRFNRITEFNRGSVGEGDVCTQLRREDARLAKVAGDGHIQWPYERVAEWALPRLVRADALALKHQRWHYKLGEALFMLAALAVTAVAAQQELALSETFALVEVGLMLAALGIYAVARSRAAHERWLGYRSLAEAFRSALFIVLVGAGREREASLEPWFQRAFSEAWESRPEIVPERSQVAELRRFVVAGWIDDQIEYHERARERFARSRQRLTVIVLLMFGLTVIAGLLHAFDPFHSDAARKVFVFLAIALPGFGAALTGIRDQRQHRIHEQRSERTASRLEQLKRDVESQPTLQSLQKLTAQVQGVIEDENIEWSGVVEFQELEMVI